MKKITFLFITLLSAYGATAQITVTQSDMPAAGNAYVNANDTIPTVTPGNTGSGQTWNFAALKANTTSVDSFVAASATPYAAAFATANMADTTLGNAGYIFINSSASAFEGVGTVQYVMGYQAKIALNPPFVQISLPATLNSTDGGTSSGSAKLPITYLTFDSARVVARIIYADTIDASGSMTTPFGVHNVLRQKHSETDIDSLYVHSASFGWVFYQAQKRKNYQYRWYTNGLGDLVANMQMDTTNTKVKSVKWYDGIPNAVTEISQRGSIMAYPNPCSSQINFFYSGHTAQVITVFDVTGRQVGTTSMVNGKASVNTSTFAKGIYMYRMLDKSGDVVDNGKFSVQ
jgi:hypothetical protein